MRLAYIVFFASQVLAIAPAYTTAALKLRQCDSKMEHFEAVFRNSCYNPELEPMPMFSITLIGSQTGTVTPNF